MNVQKLMNGKLVKWQSLILFASRLQFLFLFLMIVLPACRKGSHDEYSVKSGYFKQSIIETGELEAVKASYITMPLISWQYGYQFKIIGLLEHGRRVGKGDSVVMIDPSSLYKFIIDREDQLEIEIAASEKQKVQMENTIQDLNAQLKNEQAAYDLKMLEVERMKFESDNKRKIKELEFQQASIRLNKIKRNLELRPKLDSYDVKIQKIKVIQRESEIKNAKETLQRLKIRSPQDGIFQVKRNMFTGQYVRLGDNVYIGSMIASIPDIVKMRAKTYVNETDINKVIPGMRVIVRLDALPSVAFNGRITGLSKICTTRDREKIFNVEVDILESDVRLKPGMTVSCEYLCYETDTAIFVPNNCLMKDRGRSFIYIKKGRTPHKVEVWSGPANSNHTVIKGEVEAGQKLIPFENIPDKK